MTAAAMRLVEVEDTSLDMIAPFLEPIRALLYATEVTEIMINPNGRVFYEQDGELDEWHCPEGRPDPEDLIEAGKAIARPALDFGLHHPIVDAILPDGSRVAAMYPGCAVGQVGLTIRKFRRHWWMLEQLVEAGMFDNGAADIMRDAIESGRNILLAGGTGTGKTTMQAALIGCVPETERLVVIEDSPELRIDRANVFRCAAQREVRGANDKLIAAGVTMRQLVKAALRHRPDRIIIGEVRDAEAFDLIDAMNTGHRGSISTIHANSPRQALARLASLSLRARLEMRYADLLLEVGHVVEIVVQIERAGRRRRVAAIDEVRGYDPTKGRFRMKRLCRACSETP